MEIKLLLETFESARKKASVSIKLNAEETSALEKKICPRHADSILPVPCVFYLSPNPDIKVVNGTPSWEGTAYKAYFLKAARMVPLNRSIPEKTLMRFPFPGTIELGYINPHDEPKLMRWWQPTKKAIIEDLRKKIFSVGPTQKQFTPSGEKTEDTSNVNLNPINTNEKAGMRKRCLEEF